MNPPSPSPTLQRPCVLTIAGSDSGGSAGIQADLKTLEARGVFGATALTVVTAQNTLGVQQVLPLPLDLIAAQLDAVFADLSVNAVKTGLLGRADVIFLVHDYLTQKNNLPLVVDPVLVNGQGQRIVSEETLHAYRTALLSLATVITPNLDEAALLAEMPALQRSQDFYEAAERLHTLGAAHILIKGGHLSEGETLLDLFYDGQSFVELYTKTLPIKNPHGVGCTFASAIAAEIAKGHSPLVATQNAHAYLQRALIGALHHQVGKGRQPVYHRVDCDR